MGCPNGDFHIFFVDRLEKGESDDVVPVKVAEEQIDFLFVFKSVAERTDAGSRIEYNEGVAISQFKTAGIAAKASILGTADRTRSSSSPKFKLFHHPFLPQIGLAARLRCQSLGAVWPRLEAQ